MLPRVFYTSAISLLLAVSSLQAQECESCIPLPEMQHIQSPIGMAYEETICTSKLVGTVLISTVAVAVVAIALWNTPCNDHSHHDHKKDRCSHHKKCSPQHHSH